MARFKIGVAAAAPLRIQVGTPTSALIEVTRITASGDNTTGSASRPLISRPTVPGTGSGTIVSLDGRSVSRCSGITIFSGAPTIPSVSSGSFNLPLRMNTMMPKGSGFIVGISSYILLYAAASDGHTWSGELEYEEY